MPLTQPPPAPLPATPRVPWWVWLGLGLLHALALGWQLYHRQPLFPDSDRYLEAARNLSKAGVLYARPLTEQPLHPAEYSIRPPGYPVFLLVTGAPAQALPWLALGLQNLLSLLNLGLALRWLARRASGVKSTWQWGVVLVLTAAMPAQYIYANVLMSETLLQTAVVGLWLSLEAFLSGLRRGRYLAGAAAAAALALLLKPVFFPFALVLLGVGGWAAWQQRRLRLALLGAVPLAVALLWMARNEARTGYFHFSSIAEINLLHYNVRGVLQATEGLPAADAFVDTTEAAVGRQLGFRQGQLLLRRRSLAKLRQYPGTYAAQHVRGMANLLLDPGRFDVVYFLGLPQKAGTGLLQQANQGGYPAVLAAVRRLPLALLGGLLLVAAGNLLRLALLLRFACSPGYPQAGRLVLLGLVGYIALLTGPLGAARFAVPVLPLLLAGAGAGLLAAARRATR